MALGAVLISMPLSLAFAWYGVASQGFSTAETILTYSAVGSLVFCLLTLASGLRADNLR